MPAAAAPPAVSIGPVRTIGITGKSHSEPAAAAVRDAVAWLDQRPVRVVVDDTTAHGAGLTGGERCPREELPAVADLVLVLGGDGTLLSIAHVVAAVAPDTPLLAVNCGSLGFLTEITRPEMTSALQLALDGRAQVDLRPMARARVRRGDRDLADRTVLNDLVVMRSARSSIIYVAIMVRGHLVTQCRADGVMVATPTGSTGYNLAVGGPIVYPTVGALIITPIAPHTLTQRPVVIPDDAPVTLRPDLSSDHREAAATFDGQMSVDLEEGDAVLIERAPHPLRVVRSESRHYFGVLRKKLQWGGG